MHRVAKSNKTSAKHPSIYLYTQAIIFSLSDCFYRSQLCKNDICCWLFRHVLSIQSLSDSKNDCPAQSFSYLIYRNKDIPLGINSEHNWFCGSGPKGNVAKVRPKTNWCIRKFDTVCNGTHIQWQSMFQLLQVEISKLVLRVVKINRNSGTKLFCIFQMDQTIYRLGSY